MGEKSLLGLQDRIILHISHYKELKRKYDLPLALTRIGIAEATGMGSSHASRQILVLKKMNYLKSIKGRGKGKVRNQDFYYLSIKGKKRAQTLENKLKRTMIHIKGLSTPGEKVGFYSVIDHLKEAGISDINLMDICKFTSQEKVLDVGHLQKTIKKRFVDDTVGVPQITHFYGRVDEVNKLKEWIAEQNRHNIIFIHGMAGIGKTTLAAKLIDDYRGSKHLFWHEFHEMDTFFGILSKLADFLKKLGDDHLDMFLRTRTSLDQFEISRILEKSIRKLDAILVFDDFQKSDDQIRKFFVYFLGILSPSSGTKMMILSREIVPFYDSRDVLAKKTVGELGLEGLDFESSKKILKEKGITNENYRDIYGFTAGNPLFLEVFQSQGHLDRFVHDELFLKLGKQERRILDYLSVYRFPVNENILLASDDLNYETLYNLTQKSIVKRDSKDRYFIHDILKSFFYIRLSRKSRQDLHLQIAKRYSREKDGTNLIEAIYHYQEAKDIEYASKLSLNSSDRIIEEGLSPEFLVLLKRFEERDLEPEIFAKVLFIMAKTSYMTGEWKKALQYYSDCSDLGTVIEDIELKINAICESGYILEEHNELEKSLKTFVKSLAISKKGGYSFGCANSYRGIGRSLWRISQIEEAIKNYIKCLEISQREGFDNLSGSTYIDLGNAYDEKCEMSKAIECYDRSIEFLKRTNNLNEMARAYGNLGVTYRHFNNYKKAIEYHNKQLDLLKDSHYMRFIGYAYSWIGFCYSKIDDFKNARKYAIKAQEIAQKIENDNILFDVYKTYAYMFAKEKKWKEAMNYYQKSIDDATRANAFFPIAETYYEIGLLYKEAGNEMDSKEYFILAYDFYKKVGLDKSDFIKEKMDLVGLNIS